MSIPTPHSPLTGSAVPSATVSPKETAPSQPPSSIALTKSPPLNPTEMGSFLNGSLSTSGENTVPPTPSAEIDNLDLTRSAAGSPSLSRAPSVSTPSSKVRRIGPHPPVTFPYIDDIKLKYSQATNDEDPNTKNVAEAGKMVFELADGAIYEGYSFGAEGKSVSGECVFQTGKQVPTLLRRFRALT